MVAWKRQVGARAIDFRERSQARAITRLLQPTRRMVAMGLTRIAGAGEGFEPAEQRLRPAPIVQFYFGAMQDRQQSTLPYFCTDRSARSLLIYANQKGVSNLEIEFALDFM